MPVGEWKGDEGETKFGEDKAEEHKVRLLEAPLSSVWIFLRRKF